MRIIKNKTHKDNISKFCYDIAKIVIAVLIISPLANPAKAYFAAFIFGAVLASFFFMTGYSIDSKGGL